jgi:hypothetical protein
VARAIEADPAQEWQALLDQSLDAWALQSDAVVLSADVDGLTACALLGTRRSVHVIGIYTTTHLVLLDGATSEDAAAALWLDHDVSEPGVICVGQHLVNHMPGDTLPRRDERSFNPNVWQHQSWKQSFAGRAGRRRDKYPYGTCHFVAVALEVDPGEGISDVSALLAHADGTWRTVVDYAPNAEIWYRDMFDGDVFLRALIDRWHSDPNALKRHAALVNALVEAGVSNGPSRATIARALPPNLRALTGRQSIRYGGDAQRYVDRTKSVLDLCASIVGTDVDIGQNVTSVVSGTRTTPYPDRIDDFDEFMMENEIFSHAFTGLRTLSMTTGIQLIQ